jgi:cell division septal protein FtsQ
MRQSLWDRRLGGRGERRTPLTRFGGGPATRTVHAPAHVEQARGAEAGARPRLPAVALVLAGCFAAGLGGGRPLAEATRAWLSGSAPRVEAIGVRGAEQLSADEISAATGVPRGSDLRGVDADAVAAQLAQHPWIASARAVELPTGRLLVEVSERHAVATVSAREAKQAFAVDANGTAFAKLGNDALGELPRVVQSDPIVIGEPNPTLAQAVELAGQIASAGLPRPLEIAIAAADDPDGFSLRLADFAPRIVLGRDGLGERLGALARVLEAAPPEAAAAATLDLRFADQVVLRGTPSSTEAADATGKHAGAAPSGPAASGGHGGSKTGGMRS